MECTQRMKDRSNLPRHGGTAHAKYAPRLILTTTRKRARNSPIHSARRVRLPNALSVRVFPSPRVAPVAITSSRITSYSAEANLRIRRSLARASRAKAALRERKIDLRHRRDYYYPRRSRSR